MKTAKNYFAAILLLLTIVVVLQNREAVETRLLFATISIPRALLLLITLATGIAIGLLMGSRLGRLGSAKT